MSDSPKLLSGGNPQIPKGYGRASVQAYIEAMPGWKSEVGRHIDQLIVQTIPEVRLAVKWNSPFYGAPDQEGWFLSFHCFDKYIKITFFRGSSLKPLPPIGSKHPDVRYLHATQEGLDESLFVGWIRQAAILPGESL